MTQKSLTMHGRDHKHGGADLSRIAWEDIEEVLAMFASVEHQVLSGHGHKTDPGGRLILWTGTVYVATDSGTPLVTIKPSPNNHLVTLNSTGLYEVLVWGRGDPSPNNQVVWWSLVAQTGIGGWLTYTHAYGVAGRIANGTLNYDPYVNFADYVKYTGGDGSSPDISVFEQADLGDGSAGTWGDGSSVNATMLVAKLA